MPPRVAARLLVPLLAVLSAGGTGSPSDRGHIALPRVERFESQNPPRHVHLGLGPSPAEMRVAWATYETRHFNGAFHTASGNCTIDSCGGTAVQWAESAAALLDADRNSSSSSPGNRTLFTADGGNKHCREQAPDQCARAWVVHTASMGGLQPLTRYYYRVGDGGSGWSAISTFVSQPAVAAAAAAPRLHLVLGDLGSWCAFSASPACSCMVNTSCTSASTTTGLVGEVMNGDVSLAVHVGDFGYDLDSANGAVGDLFFDLIGKEEKILPSSIVRAQGSHVNASEPSGRHMPPAQSLSRAARRTWFPSAITRVDSRGPTPGR